MGAHPTPRAEAASSDIWEVSVSMWMALTQLGNTEENFLSSPTVLHTDIIHHYPSSLLFQQEFLSQEGCAPRHGKSQLHGVCAENLPLVPSEPAQAACQGQDLLARPEVSPVLSLCQDSSSGGALTADSCFSGQEPGRVGPGQGLVTRPWELCGDREEQGGRMGPMGQQRCGLSRLRWLSCCCIPPGWLCSQPVCYLCTAELFGSEGEITFSPPLLFLNYEFTCCCFSFLLPSHPACCPGLFGTDCQSLCNLCHYLSSVKCHEQILSWHRCLQLLLVADQLEFLLMICRWIWIPEAEPASPTVLSQQSLAELLDQQGCSNLSRGGERERMEAD